MAEPGEGPVLRLFALRGKFTHAPLLGPWPENRLRGVLGTALRRIACALPGQFVAKKGCGGCPVQADCAYALLFHGTYPEGTPQVKRHARLPRPYVIYWDFESETDFVLWITVVGDHLETIPHLVLALSEAGREGVGKKRDTYFLTDLRGVNPIGTEPQVEILSMSDAASIETWPAFDVESIARYYQPFGYPTTVRITLVKPTMLRDAVGRPPLSPAVFVARLLERISLLTLAYCPGRALPPHESLRRQADELRFSAPPFVKVTLTRHSRRQDRALKLEAILGEAEWTGDLSGLYPYLVLGQWLHVGKATAFGLGRYRVMPL